jgi:hypothetical protein
MAFQSAAGWGNLPNGVFSPVIYSKKVQKTFRKTAVANAITNNDYFGEIANMGDSVRIMKEPEIQIAAYARGAKVTPQDLLDSDFTLVIDKAYYWSFKMDDIEEAHSHVNFESLATDRAAYVLADKFDAEVLGYMSGYNYDVATGLWTANTSPTGTKSQDSADSDELLSYHKLTKSAFSSSGTGTNSIPLGVKGTYDATPLELLARFGRLLDQQNVPKDGRWAVVDPVFMELLYDEDSKFMNHDYVPDGDRLTNGLVTTVKVRGFDLRMSQNLQSAGTGPGTISTTGSATNYGTIIAGHNSAVASAENLAKTETLRAQDTFGDIFRGMHVYGRKILRPEALLRASWNVSK